jgi:hypothetical protein
MFALLVTVFVENIEAYFGKWMLVARSYHPRIPRVRRYAEFKVR